MGEMNWDWEKVKVGSLCNLRVMHMSGVLGIVI